MVILPHSHELATRRRADHNNNTNKTITYKQTTMKYEPKASGCDSIHNGPGTAKASLVTSKRTTARWCLPGGAGNPAKRIRTLSSLALVMLFTCGPAFPADQASQLAHDNAGFALDLYRKLDSGTDNLFFSPHSISMALAMAHAGARGTTAAQMAKVLHLSLPPDKPDAAYAELGRCLDAVWGRKKVTLATANSIWPGKQHKLLASYTSLLKTNYGVSITPLDFTRPEAARDKINRWVGSQTRDKIKDIISSGGLSPDTRLVLVNAAYFYGKWARPFQRNDTRQADFHVSPAKTLKVPMMWQENSFRYAEMDHLKVLELPYLDRALAMLVVLPKSNNGLEAVESGLSQKALDKWMRGLRDSRVEVYLPKFQITWGSGDMGKTLRTLGMKDAFDREKADFSGMSDEHPGFYIDSVIHKAFISVYEEGTEAAAATALDMRSAAAAPHHTELFRADHPFLFLIRENTTGCILFMGRVTHPG